MMTLLQFLDRFPPCAVRLAARMRGRPMSNANIADLSGLSRGTVNRLSRMRSWHSITIRVASIFCIACQADIVRPRRLREYFKRGKFSHLAKGLRKYFISIANEQHP